MLGGNLDLREKWRRRLNGSSCVSPQRKNLEGGRDIWSHVAGGDHVAGEDQDKGDLILTDRGFVYSLSWLLSLAKSMVVAPS